MRRSFTTVLVALPLLLAACAHADAVPPPQDRVVLAVESAPPPIVDPDSENAPRPRLSKTVTLGYSENAPMYAPPPGATGPNVVVNNNITVGGAQPYGYYGYGYGYGYGAYGYGARGGHTVTRSAGAAPASTGWGTTGWEGSNHTAAPGHTPAVGGNWAPAPSYGPRSPR